MTQPNLHAWTEEGQALRLIAQMRQKDDLDPKALACYGLLVSCPAAPETLPEQAWPRFQDPCLRPLVSLWYNPLKEESDERKATPHAD